MKFTGDDESDKLQPTTSDELKKRELIKAYSLLLLKELKASERTKDGVDEEPKATGQV